jgi:hypothetical protein
MTIDQRLIVHRCKVFPHLLPLTEVLAAFMLKTIVDFDAFVISRDVSPLDS